MKISKIEQGKKRSDRANIYLDGQYVFSLSFDLVLENGLRKDLALTQEQINQMVESDGLTKAYDRAIRFLGYRKRSAKEVKEKLLSLEYSEPVVADVVERLARFGYVNDYDFAESWVRDRLNLKPTAKRVLRMELRQKGISEEIADAVLSEVDTETEIEQAKKLAIKRYSPAFSPAEQKEKTKAYLLQKGFGWDVVKAVVEDLF